MNLSVPIGTKRLADVTESVSFCMSLSRSLSRSVLTLRFSVVLANFLSYSKSLFLSVSLCLSLSLSLSLARAASR
jgi:hypothetical protein